MEKLRKFIEIEKKDIAEMRDEGINKFDTDVDAWEQTILVIEAELNEATNDSTAEKYEELIMAVENKYRGESRHQTALRYIKEREYRDFGTGKAVRNGNAKQMKGA